MTTTQQPRYRVLGTTDDCTTCGVCGREDLKSTVVLDGGDGTLYAGSDCAAKLAGRPVKAIETEARRADRAAKEEARRAEALARQAASVARNERLAYWVRSTYGLSIEQAERLDGMTPFKLRLAYRAATGDNG